MMRIHRRAGPSAHTVVKRVPQVTQGTSTDSSSQVGNTGSSRTGDYAKGIVASSTPPSTIALAVLLAVAVSAFILGCVYWRIRKRRIQRSGGAQNYSSSPHSTLFGVESRLESVESESSSFGLPSANVEKPGRAFVIPSRHPNEEHGWTPQIRNYRGVPLVNGELPRHVQAAREGKSMLQSVPERDLKEEEKEKLAGEIRTEVRSVSQGDLNEKEKPAGEICPPSTSAAVNGHRPTNSVDTPRGPPPGIPLPPTPPEAINIRPPTPPTPPANGKKPKLTPPPLSKHTGPMAFLSSRFSHSPLPKEEEHLTSPARVSSFAHQQEITAQSPVEIKTGTGKDGLPLPRMMTVIHTFAPSLEDEMLVHIGDAVNMLEEYSDGWCLVQRYGKHDAPRGVVPRFCLAERQSKRSTRRNIIKSIQTSAKRI